MNMLGKNYTRPNIIELARKNFDQRIDHNYELDPASQILLNISMTFQKKHE